MKLISQEVTRAVSRALLQTRKNSPHIFFVAGAIGVVGSAVLACRATLKLEETVEEVKKDFANVKSSENVARAVGKPGYSAQIDREHYAKMAKLYLTTSGRFIKLYGPSAAIGTASIALLTGSHIQLTRRNAALGATLSLVMKSFDEYRDRVREEVGEEKELDIYQGVKTQEIEVDGVKELVKLGDPNALSPYARFFDETSWRWEKNPEVNRNIVQAQQNYANHILHARGHLFLNEVYEMLGLDHSQAGAIVGWVISDDSDGDGYVDFGLFEPRNNRFVNGWERSILLDFNVDGVIFNKI